MTQETKERQMAVSHNMGAGEKTRATLSAGLEALSSLSGLKHPIAPPVLLYFLTVLLPIGFPLGTLYLNLMKLLLIIIIIPATIKLVIGDSGKIIITDVLFAVYCFWTLISLIANNPDLALESAGSTSVEFWGGYILGRVYIRTREDFIAIVRLIAFVMVCTTPFALFEAIVGTPVILSVLDQIPGITTPQIADIGRRYGIHRTQLVFDHPIHFGLFCATMLSLCWVGMHGIYSKGTRLVVSGAILISGICAMSSGAILALLLQLGLITWAWIFRHNPKRWFILVGLGAAFYIFVSLASNRTPLQVFLSYAAFSAHNAYVRLAIFEAGIENVFAHPLWGLGFNDWVRPSWLSPSVDNFWLLIAMRHGIPGFLMLAVGYAWVVIKLVRRNFDSDIVLWQFRRAWIFSFLGLAFTLTTVHIWRSIYSFTFFMFATGVWMLTAPVRNTVIINDRVEEKEEDPLAASYQRRLTRTKTSRGESTKTSVRAKRSLKKTTDTDDSGENTHYSRDNAPKGERIYTLPQTTQGQDREERGTLNSHNLTNKTSYTRFSQAEKSEKTTKHKSYSRQKRRIPKAPPTNNDEET